MDPLKASEIQDKVLKYEYFINDVLKEDLKEVNELLDKKNSELAEWIQLKSVLNTLVDNKLIEGFKTKVDIGTNMYVQAEVDDPSIVFVNVGCNIYVQYSVPEALRHCEKEINLIKRQIDVIRKRSAEIKGKIKFVLHGIQELSNIK